LDLGLNLRPSRLRLNRLWLERGLSGLRLLNRLGLERLRVVL
jgi:DNA-binding Xre family transcriptional regulator